MEHYYLIHCLVLASLLLCYPHETAGYEVFRYPSTGVDSRYPWRDFYPLKRDNVTPTSDPWGEGVDAGRPFPNDNTTILRLPEGTPASHSKKASNFPIPPRYNAAVTSSLSQGYEVKVIYVPVADTRAWLPML